jgi:hypothetical protein
MLVLEKKFWFKTATVVLDDAEALKAARENMFDRLTIITHSQLSLPGFSCKKKTTGIIPIGDSIEGVIARFEPRRRSEVRKAERDGRLRVIVPDDDREGGVRLYREFEQSIGRIPYPASAHKGTLLACAYLDGRAVSGILFYPSAPIMRIRHLFSARIEARSSAERTQISIATRRLVVEICRWGIEHGRKGLDLNSINAEDPRVRSIAQFKMGFNPVLIPEYTYVRRSFSYNIAEYIMSILLTAKRKLKWV